MAKSTTKKRSRRSARRSARPQPPIPTEPQLPIERVQLGVRIEKRLAKVLKGVAEYSDLTLGEMLEEIVLHAFEGESTFGPRARQKIVELKSVYDLDYDVHGSFRFREPE